MFYPDGSGKCPYCHTTVRFEGMWLERQYPLEGAEYVEIHAMTLRTKSRQTTAVILPSSCPGCEGFILLLSHIITRPGLAGETREIQQVIWPDATSRPIPVEVEAEAPEMAADFREAAVVLPKSKKASAALSRRCLQYLLREKGGVTHGNLSKEIEQVIDKLPSELGKAVDAIRNIGNFAAHPIKDTNSGEIVDVEEGEAEWLLDILEALFEHYYVEPARLKARRDRLNEKLRGINKPQLKTP